jgi:hypothetical protein
VAAGEALEHQPGPGVREGKKRRDRLIAEAARHPDWVVGLRDETWWTRRAQPGLLAWAAEDPLRLAGNARDPKGGGPEAVACDGALRPDTGRIRLRFCDGRPVRATTEEFLGWVCEQPAAEREAVLVLVGDNAAWPVRRRVRRWISRHDRRGRTGGGCRIRVCGRPVKAAWLSRIEPRWGHGKRAVVEPDRKLTAEELRQRGCDYYGGPKQPPLPKPQI